MIDNTQTVSEVLQAHDPNDPDIWIQVTLANGVPAIATIKIYDSRWRSIEALHENGGVLCQLRTLHARLTEMITELERREALQETAEPCPEATTNDQPSTR